MVSFILDPQGIQNYTQDFQFCGGYLDPNNFTPLPYIKASGVPNKEPAKGFICPVGSICLVRNQYPINADFSGGLQSLQWHRQFRQYPASNGACLRYNII